MPWLPRCASCLCAWKTTDQGGLEMPAGSSKNQFCCEGNSSGTVHRVCLWLVDPSANFGCSFLALSSGCGEEATYSVSVCNEIISWVRECSNETGRKLN